MTYGSFGATSGGVSVFQRMSGQGERRSMLRCERLCHHPVCLLTPQSVTKRMKPAAILGLALFVAASLLHCATAIADDAAVWQVVRTLPSQDAHQAAAADERFLYAISSERIARYDRFTDEPAGMSRGPAKHLNSGFLWDGRLYCAHSNFPKLPEESEVKVLDLASMELTTFHKFDNPGGSLTWSIRDGETWWCNFARYGADNAKSFLARYDLDWKETGRWTYPAELVAKLGRNSLSGGILRDGEFLATGHDDPVLFRLAIPKEGNELTLLGTMAVPFTGQGIAIDPRTGGLLGIHRGKKLLLMAESEAAAARRLRVMTYNIHHGEGTDGKLDLPRIAAVIRSTRADLVALQEVDRKVPRSGGVDQAEELGRLTGMRHAFGPSIPLSGGEYGNAILSRLPITRTTRHLLPKFDNGEQRSILEAEIELSGETRPMRILATHLDHRPNDRERLASVEAIEQLARTSTNSPVLLAGDLNDSPGSAVLERLTLNWSAASPGPLSTIPSDQPKRQIDFVLQRASMNWKIIDIRVVAEPVASDHRPLLIVLERP